MKTLIEFCKWFWICITGYVILSLVYQRAYDMTVSWMNWRKRRNKPIDYDTLCMFCDHPMMCHHTSGFCQAPYCYCGLSNVQQLTASKNQIWEDLENMQRRQNYKPRT